MFCFSKTVSKYFQIEIHAIKKGFKLKLEAYFDFKFSRNTAHSDVDSLKI